MTIVKPNTPAEGHLNVGDQILSINGHDVKGLTHAEVIKLIRSPDERIDNEMVLTIQLGKLFNDFVFFSLIIIRTKVLIV